MITIMHTKEGQRGVMLEASSIDSSTLVTVKSPGLDK